MNQPQEQRLIADIKQVLESQPLDQNSRLALQKARAHALASSSTSWRKLPWLPFALTASLITVLVVNLPNKPSAPADITQAKPIEVAVSNPPNKIPNKPIAASSKKPAAIKTVVTAPAVDADLLENLDLYEDAEFYQWLSEQDGQGVTDA